MRMQVEEDRAANRREGRPQASESATSPPSQTATLEQLIQRQDAQEQQMQRLQVLLEQVVSRLPEQSQQAVPTEQAPADSTEAASSGQPASASAGGAAPRPRGRPRVTRSNLWSFFD